MSPSIAFKAFTPIPSKVFWPTKHANPDPPPNKKALVDPDQWLPTPDLSAPELHACRNGARGRGGGVERESAHARERRGEE